MENIFIFKSWSLYLIKDFSRKQHLKDSPKFLFTLIWGKLKKKQQDTRQKYSSVPKCIYLKCILLGFYSAPTNLMICYYSWVSYSVLYLLWLSIESQLFCWRAWLADQSNSYGRSSSLSYKNVWKKTKGNFAFSHHWFLKH